MKLIGKPTISMGHLYHGKLLNNHRVPIGNVSRCRFFVVTKQAGAAPSAAYMEMRIGAVGKMVQLGGAQFLRWGYFACH